MHKERCGGQNGRRPLRTSRLRLRSVVAYQALSEKLQMTPKNRIWTSRCPHKQRVGGPAAPAGYLRAAPRLGFRHRQVAKTGQGPTMGVLRRRRCASRGANPFSEAPDYGLTGGRASAAISSADLDAISYPGQ